MKNDWNTVFASGEVGSLDKRTKAPRRLSASAPEPEP
jgi:hypothetical protein